MHAAAFEQRVESGQDLPGVLGVRHVDREHAARRGEAFEDDEKDVGAADRAGQKDHGVRPVTGLEPAPVQAGKGPAPRRHAHEVPHGGDTLSNPSIIANAFPADPVKSRMDGFLRDLRFTIRNMGRSPGLAVVIAVSLALGIGANTAIFSLIHAVMMKSLPVQDPDRLVLLHWFGETWPRGLEPERQRRTEQPGLQGREPLAGVSVLPRIAHKRRASSTRSSRSRRWAASGRTSRCRADGGAERVDGEMVSGDYFRGLGVSRRRPDA